MRELKFRAWTRQTPSMAWSQRAVAITGTGEQMVPIGGTYTGVWHVNDDGLIIEQYTGLKDKNGKEIYEGDIVVNTYYDDGEMYKVLWVDDSVAFGMESLDDMELYKLPLESLEVIGNIHENPELLEEEE